MLLQINTPEELHKRIKIEKINRDLNTLEETIIELLEERLK